MRVFPRPGQPRGPLVVSARPSEVLGDVDRRLLTAAERRRGAGLASPVDQDAHAAAHLLVRWCVAVLTGRPIETLELRQRCPDCGSTEHGKPYLAGLPGLHVSLAHTRDAVVAGAGRGPIGVDVEDEGAGALGTAAMPQVLSDGEMRQVRSAVDVPNAFLRHWVRKECLVKMGVATLDTLRQADLSDVTDEVVDGGRTRSRFGSLHLVDWHDPSLSAVLAAAAPAEPVLYSFPHGGPGG